MKQNNDAEIEYQGNPDAGLKDEQLDAAVRALHVLAVLQNGNSEWMSNYALDALREIEALGYMYESYTETLN